MRTIVQKQSLLMLLFLFFFHQVIGQNNTAPGSIMDVTLERTERRVLHSNIANQEYELFVSLPKSYATSNQSYPIIIALDAYRSFLIIKNGVDVFSTPPADMMPEVILVGVGYGGDESNSLVKFAVGRTRDLTPTENSIAEVSMEKQLQSMGFIDIRIQTGGASLFLEFIRHELLPYIHFNYRADMENKTFYGYSYGGLFGLYTLFHAPETFNRYLIGSPSIHYDGGITYAFESEYAKSHHDLNAAVFMSSGSLEKGTMVNVLKMEQLLSSRNYPNLILTTVIFENESHISCAPAAISRGLVVLFGVNF